MNGDESSIKAGYAGRLKPVAVVPSVVGHPTIRADGSKSISHRVLSGQAALNEADSLSLTYPIDNGIVRSWDGLAMLWDQAFSALKPNSDSFADNKILITEPSFHSDKSREKTFELLFEKYGFNSAFLSLQSVVALYSQGWSTGIVVTSGEGVTDIVPVYDGYALPHASRRVNVAGRDVTRYLVKLLSLRGHAFNRNSDLEAIKRAKETLCYTGFVEDEKKLAMETVTLERSFSLPDGRSIDIGSERFEAPEIMFQPSLVDVESPGLAEQIFSVIQSTDMDLRSSFYQNILLTGGNTLFPGFSTRLKKELENLYLDRILKGCSSRMDRLKLNIVDSPSRLYSVFQGASLLADVMNGNDSLWISASEWAESGSRIFSRLGPR